jgi:hypothetical protein
MIITPDTIAAALETAPGWATVALTVPQSRLRQDARLEVANHLYAALYPPASHDAAQLRLPL